MAIDGAWVALSPLGPGQNARFYGLSNLLETFLLVPALAGAALLGRRFGAAGFAAVAILSLVAVAGSRFGADAGGALVLAAGYAALVVALVRDRRRAAVLALVAAAAAVTLVALDALGGPSTHLGETLRGGPAEILSDVADRVTLSWLRATDTLGMALTVLGATAALALLVARLPRLSLARFGKGLLAAFAVAVLASLVVNDSPKEVAIGGLAGYLALERWLRTARLESGAYP
jgi:hypothetical protein